MAECSLEWVADSVSNLDLGKDPQCTAEEDLANSLDTAVALDNNPLVMVDLAAVGITGQCLNLCKELKPKGQKI